MRSDRRCGESNETIKMRRTGVRNELLYFLEMIFDSSRIIFIMQFDIYLSALQVFCRDISLVDSFVLEKAPLHHSPF